MIALLSNGITSEKLHNKLSKHITGKKAAVVLTADNEYKERNYHNNGRVFLHMHK